MKSNLPQLTFALSLLCAAPNIGQDQNRPAGSAGAKPNSGEAQTRVSQEELEAKFKVLLTKATLSGRWAPIENARLGPEKKEDKYSIVSASKIEGDKWVVSAKMQYGKTEMTIPVPVRVQWSGDTPVIIVDNFSMGGNRSYSSRVLFYNDTYSGSWTSSSGYGGLLYGSITHDGDSSEKPVEKKPEPK